MFPTVLEIGRKRVEPEENNGSDVSFHHHQRTDVAPEDNNSNNSDLSHPQSEDLRKSTRTHRLCLLVLQSRLEEFGFRKNSYKPYLTPEYLGVENVNFRNLNDCLNRVCELIVTDASRVRPVQMDGSSSMNSNRNLGSSGPISQRLKIIGLGGRQEVLFVCAVCFQEIYESTMMKSSECGHRFCDSCFRGHVEECMKEGKFTVLCLEVECGRPVADKQIEMALGQQKYRRFKYFKTKKELENDPNNHFCIKPNCEGLLQNKQDDWQCAQCAAPYCGDCWRLRHEGDCEDNLNGAIQRVYENLKIKKCPKCKAPIQKSDGCNHMTCKKCMFEFCWICLGAYSKYHYRYFNCFGCPGMQFQDQEDRCKERLKQVVFLLLLPLLITFLIVITLVCLPIFIVASIFVKPYRLVIECAEPDYDCCCYDCCGDDCEDCSRFGFKCMFLYLLALPLGVLYAIFIAPFKFFAMVYYQILDIIE